MFCDNPSNSTLGNEPHSIESNNLNFLLILTLSQEQFPEVEDEFTSKDINTTLRAASQNKFHPRPRNISSNDPPTHSEYPNYYYYKEPTSISYPKDKFRSSFADPVDLNPPYDDQNHVDKSKRAVNMNGAATPNKDFDYPYVDHSTSYYAESISTPLTDFLLKQHDEKMRNANEEQVKQGGSHYGSPYAGSVEKQEPQFYLNYNMYDSFGPKPSENRTPIEKKLDIEKLAMRFLSPTKKAEELPNSVFKSPSSNLELLYTSKNEDKYMLPSYNSNDRQFYSNSDAQKTESPNIEKIVQKILDEKKEEARRSFDDKQIKNIMEMENIVKGILINGGGKPVDMNNAQEMDGLVRNLLYESRKSENVDDMESLVKNIIAEGRKSIRNEQDSSFRDVKDMENLVANIIGSPKKNNDSNGSVSEKNDDVGTNTEENERILKETFEKGKKPKETIQELLSKYRQTNLKCDERHSETLKNEDLPKKMEESLEKQSNKINEEFENLIKCEIKSQNLSMKSEEEIVELRGGIDLLMDQNEKPKERKINFEANSQKTKEFLEGSNPPCFNNSLKEDIVKNEEEEKKPDFIRNKAKTMQNAKYNSEKVGNNESLDQERKNMTFSFDGKERKGSGRFEKLNERLDEILSKKNKSGNNSMRSSENFASNVQLKKADTEILLLSGTNIYIVTICV